MVVLRIVHNIAQRSVCRASCVTNNIKYYSHLNKLPLTQGEMSKLYRLPECQQNGTCLEEVNKISNGESKLISNVLRGVHEGKELVDTAVKLLKSDGVIAVPTDTIYGVCCLAQRSDAVNKICEIKRRCSEKPLAISVDDIPNIYRWGKVTIPDTLLRELLPGPVTVVLERTAELNRALNPGTRLVGIRVPDSGFVRDVCRACGEPIALTSANISNQQSSLCVEEFREMWSELDAVFDGGLIASCSKAGSTVVDLSSPGLYRIIRPGTALESTVEKLQRYHLEEDRTVLPSFL